ncbi:hypothetical protein LINGRAPRIM_LOCUS1877 [Linum grandiflorum]
MVKIGRTAAGEIIGGNRRRGRGLLSRRGVRTTFWMTVTVGESTDRRRLKTALIPGATTGAHTTHAA